MQVFTRAEIQAWDREYRRRFMNAVIGYRPAVWVATRHENGHVNLAVFNSLVHLGADPPFWGLMVRPLVVPRQTYQNAIREGFYSINWLFPGALPKAHQASANYPEGVSEAEDSDLSCRWDQDFPSVPFISDSAVSGILSFAEELEVKSTGVVLLVGRLEKLLISGVAVEADGHVDMSATLVVQGLEQYGVAQPLMRLPYARTVGEKDELKG